MVGGFRAELMQLKRSRLFLVLVTIQAVAFLLLISLFGLTGSRAPVAVVNNDNGAYSRDFIATLAFTHHSFSVKPMSSEAAQSAIKSGNIVAIITIPSDFSDSVLYFKPATVMVDVDNIDTDMTEDVQRALPSAIVSFGRRVGTPDIRVRVNETDLIDHDTDFIPYLVVSGLVLDAFVIAAILGAMSVAREFEKRTVALLITSPVHPIFPVLGRVAATNIVAVAVMAVPLLLVMLGYKVHPLHPIESLLALIVCIGIFSCVGVAFGALVKRTVPVTALVIGLSLPIYICSGSLEPARFDGNKIWFSAHLSPVYYAIGVGQDSFHGLRVTPEPIAVDAVALIAWAALSLGAAAIVLRRQLR